MSQSQTPTPTHAPWPEHRCTDAHEYSEHVAPAYSESQRHELCFTHAPWPLHDPAATALVTIDDNVANAVQLATS
jgi:hypothetical protein